MFVIFLLLSCIYIFVLKLKVYFDIFPVRTGLTKNVFIFMSKIFAH